MTNTAEVVAVLHSSNVGIRNYVLAARFFRRKAESYGSQNRKTELACTSVLRMAQIRISSFVFS